jgi:DNA-binding response OmpR family regulator
MRRSAMKRILIIDDENDFCFFTKKNLESLGNFKVYCARDGNEGLRLARTRKPDLILLDIIMPGRNGFGVLQKLKEDEKTASIPVIIFSVKEDEQSKLKAAELYSEDYIVKPIQSEVLSSKIEEVLSRFVTAKDKQTDIHTTQA